MLVADEEFVSCTVIQKFWWRAVSTPVFVVKGDLLHFTNSYSFKYVLITD